MKKTFSILFLSVSFLIHAQTQKIFNGTFPDSRVQNGKASYAYYENLETKENIKDGKFTYTFLGVEDFKGFNETINGAFKNGKKEGAWTYSITLVDFDVEDGIKSSSGKNKFSTGFITLSANYKDGLPTGSWNYKYSLKKRSKYIVQGQMKWDVYSPIKTRTLSYNFKNGILTGNISISDEFYKFSLKGNFDNNGVMNGTWKRLDEGNSMDMTFKKGCLITYVGRYVNTGEVNSQGGNPTDTIKMLTWSSTPIEKRDNLDFRIDTVSLLNNDNEPVYRYLYYHLYNDDLFLYSQISGDLGFEHKIKGAYRFEVKNLVSINQLYSDYVKRYNDAENNFSQKNYVKASYDYKYVLDANKNVLKQQDLFYLLKRSKQSDSLLSIQSSEKEIYKNEFKEFYESEFSKLKEYYKVFWNNYNPILKDSYGEYRYPESHPNKGSKGGNNGMFTILPTDESEWEAEKEKPVSRESILFSNEDLIKALSYQNYLNSLRKAYNREKWGNWDKETRDNFYKKIEKRKFAFYENCK